MKAFVEPAMEINELQVEDVITTSDDPVRPTEGNETGRDD